MRYTGAGLFTSIVLLTAAASAQAQATGPVGYWKGDDGAAPTVAIDSSTGGNNGTYTSGATTSTSVPTLQFTNSRSMQFTTAGAVVNAPTFSWPVGGPVTVSFWNNVTTAQVNNVSAFSVGNVDQPNRFQAHAPWGDKVLYWDYGDAGATGRVQTSYAAYLDKWTHVALVSAGNGGSFRAIYLDGMLAVSNTSASGGPTVALTGVNIGRWPGTNLQHAGLIDDFRIYDRVLSATEIQALANGFTELPAPTGLTATQSTVRGEINLTWNAVTGATGYILYRGTAAGGPYPTAFPLAGTSYTDTGLSDFTTYYYVVTAVGVLGESPQSAQASATTLNPPPRTQKLGNGEHCGCSSISGVNGFGAGLVALATALAFALRRPIR